MAFNSLTDAELLRKAMKGFGTDDKALVSIITSRTNDQLQEVRRAFREKFNRDLIDDIKSETSGDYERAVAGLVYTIAEYNAKQCNKAMKGAGTDEEKLIQTLVHQTDAELEAIKIAYLNMYGKTLQHDIEGDCSGLEKKFFLALINNRRVDDDPDPVRIQIDVDGLYSAGQGKWGTDEKAFLDKITTHGPRYLAAMNEEYGRRHGDTLVRAISKEMSGIIAKGLHAMLTPHDDYFADLIHLAVDGMGTDEDLLTRVLVSKRNKLQAINSRFMQKYGKSIHGRIGSETSGNVGKVLEGIAANT